MTSIKPIEHRILEWLAQADIPACELLPLTGDISTRTYYRVRSRTADRTWIVAYYPPELRSRVAVFAHTTEMLSAAGVRVPRLHRVEESLGLALLEDAGELSLYNSTDEHARLLELYQRAAALIDTIAALPAEEVAAVNPPLDRELFDRELRQTWRLFLERELRDDQRLAAELRSALATICARLDRGPRVACHRDFMSRNIQLSGNELVVLDHQDLRLGPPEYDLASLLHDSCRLDRTDRDRFADALARDPECFARCTVQRMLKIVGTFHAFAQRGFDRHLILVPDALATAARHLDRLPEGRSVAAPLLARWCESG